MTTVTTTEYRARLKYWHERAAAGDEIVVTDRDRPVVRVTSARTDSLLDSLEQQGLLRRGDARARSTELDPVPAPGDSTSFISTSRDR